MIVDPANPCDGAVPREHSQFFDPHGVFVSLDWNGAPVDDGTYEVIDDRTFVVSKEFPDVTFHYTIDGTSIMFEPVIPDCSPDCFEAAWSVSVEYPGESWELVGEAPHTKRRARQSMSSAASPTSDRPGRSTSP